MDLDLVLQVVNVAHRGQVDKGGMSYIGHLERVRKGVVSRFGRKYSVSTLEDLEAAALLHDSLEDKKLSEEFILNLTNSSVLGIVKSLTRPEKFSYEDYIAGMNSSWVIDVKIADLYDNLDPQRMKLLPPDIREKMCKRYYAALDVLEVRKF